MQPSQPSSLFARLMAVVLMLSSILFIANGALAQAPADLQAPDAPPQNSLSGVVTVAGGGFPAQAAVLAWRGARHPVAPIDSTSGAYSLALWDGDWTVTVVPVPPTSTSPLWVYTGGPQVVHFDANPDPVTPARLLNFSVAPATGILAGSVVAPGAASLAAPNRVWVRAQNQEGLGNTVQVDETSGAFSLNVLPGNTIVRLTFENPLWAGPVELSGAQWFVDDGVTVALDPITLVSKDARINGVVRDGGGSPVANLPVHAWRLDGALSVKGVTGADGSYQLPVIQGVWEVQVNPPAASGYVAAQTPQRVLLATPSAVATQNLGVVLADVTVSGTLVDKNGALVPNLEGRVVALYPDGVRWPQFGEGAAIKNSTFTLKLSSSVSGAYRIKTALADRSGYTAISAIHLTVAAGETRVITIPVAPNNSTISGLLIDRTDLLVQTGLPAAIYGASNSGALKREKVNPLDGSYLFNVAASDTSGQGGTFWWLKAFVDPTSGWTVQQPRLSKVFLPYNYGEGADVSANFLVAQVNALISGTVSGANGAPLSGARVSVVEKGTVTAAVAFRRWTYTNAAGHYALRVPAGSYKVTADERNAISPLPVLVSIAGNQTKTVNLQFRPKNAEISGTVVVQGAPQAAFIRAYSAMGAHIFAQTDLNGAWTLHLSAGETWHIQAVAETGGQFLKSERLNLVPAPGTDGSSYLLTLLPSETLPESLVLNFDASLDQVLTLSNGAQVVVPGGALAPSGMVSVAVHPKMDLADDANATPVSFGYRLLAFDESHTPILHFNTPITLVIPFTAEQLAQLGITTEQLIPSYWDPASSSWKAVPNYSLQVFSNGSGAVHVAVDHFTDYGLLTATYEYRLFVPLTQH